MQNRFILLKRFFENLCHNQLISFGLRDEFPCSSLTTKPMSPKQDHALSIIASEINSTDTLPQHKRAAERLCQDLISEDDGFTEAFAHASAPTQLVILTLFYDINVNRLTMAQIRKALSPPPPKK
jgi:hypothetical protein